MNWDDLRFFLALNRTGSLSGAARLLDVNHATVGRRIDAFAEAAGGALFQKTPEGFALTVLGEALLPSAEETEAAVMKVQRAVRNADQSLRGEVKVTASQLMSHVLLLPASAELRKVHPEIIVDVIEGTRFLNLSRQEADIALRFQLDRQFDSAANVRVSYLGAMGWCLCAAPQFAAKHGLKFPVTHVGNLPLVAYDDTAPGKVGLQWLAEHGAPEPNIVVSSNSMYTIRSAIAQQQGLGFLPRVWAIDAGLIPLSESVRLAHVFVAIHPDLSGNARIRAVYEQIVDFARRQPQLFEPV